MEKVRQAYKMYYSKCAKGGEHQGQDLNLLCLDQGCSNAFLCSVCKNSQHVGHDTKPFKYCIQKVLEKIQTEGVAQCSFQNIRARREQFLVHLKKIVETISLQFKTLEKKILCLFDKLLEEGTKRVTENQDFKAYYEQLLSESPHKLQTDIVSKIICRKPQSELPITDSLSTLSVALSKCIDSTIKQFQMRSISQEPIKSGVKITNRITRDHLILAPEIGFQSNTITQRHGNDKNLVLLPGTSYNQAIKIQLKVIMAPNKLYVGAIQFSAFEMLQNYKPFVFDPTKILKGIAWVCSDGTSSKAVINTIEKFSQNQIILATLRHDQLVVKKKMDKQYATLQCAASKQDKRIFFVAIEGEGKIQVQQIKFAK